MKALVKKGEVVGLSYEEVAMPTPKPNEVLIKIGATAICGTDVHYYLWNSSAKNFASKFGLKFPFTVGHECAGTIVAVGSDVKTRKVGERVALETHIPCGKCFQCENGEPHNCSDMGIYGTSTNGCFAPYALADEKICFVLPDEISFEEGALLEPGGVAMRAVEEAHILPGDTLVVNGCGPIGLLVVMVARASGCGNIIGIDMDPYRLNLAKKLGADYTINFTECNPVDEVQKLTQRRKGADVLIETSGSVKAYETIFDMIRLEGRIVTVGHPGSDVSINWTQCVNTKGASIKGVFGRRIWSTWHHLTSLMASKKINILDVVTHKFTFAEYEKAFAQTKSGSGKILLLPEKE